MFTVQRSQSAEINENKSSLKKCIDYKSSLSVKINKDKDLDISMASCSTCNTICKIS